MAFISAVYNVVVFVINFLCNTVTCGSAMLWPLTLQCMRLQSVVLSHRDLCTVAPMIVLIVCCCDTVTVWWDTVISSTVISSSLISSSSLTSSSLIKAILIWNSSVFLWHYEWPDSAVVKVLHCKPPWQRATAVV